VRHHILLIEDDPRARLLLEEFLVRAGLLVSSLDSGEQVLEVLSRERISLVLLDLVLPGEQGLSIGRRLRASGSRVPIIMLTAKTDALDRIVGLESGADDYVVKPFDPRELLARIRAVLRRQNERDGQTASPQSAPVYRFGPFELDAGRLTLTRSGRQLILPRGQFAVLEALVSHPRQPLSREQLLRLARRHSFVASERSMDIQIARLRRLIEEDAAEPCYIKTVWGVGYVFAPEGGET
jgi:two-component system phosphate regulon response regulator OmpR